MEAKSLGGLSLTINLSTFNAKFHNFFMLTFSKTTILTERGIFLFSDRN